jgi:ATP-dependent Lhr-like helicase
VVRIGGEERWIAVEDAARYRDSLGVSLPVGIPEIFLGPTTDAVEALMLRWARTHVPFVAAEPAQRWGLPEQLVDRVLSALAGRGHLLSGEFHPGSSGREYCHPDVLVALRRRSLSALRREIEPVPVEVMGRFLPAWQGVGVEARGLDRLAEVVHQLQGCAVPVSVIERDLLPARVAGYTPSLLDHLVSVGEVIWAGHGALGATDGRVALYKRADAARLLPPPGEAIGGEIHDAVRMHLADRGAAFFADLLRAAGGVEAPLVLEALWDLVWAGEVTNDTFLPLRSRGPVPRRSGRRPLMRLGPPGSEGRWSLVADLAAAEVSPTERLHGLAGALLQRYGVLTREAALADGVPGGFAALYPVLRAMEEAGKIRRGYFVDGLGASQFALPGAVDRLRGIREIDAAPLGLAATDPANAYGVTIPWPRSTGRTARVAGAFVVVDGGELRLYLERGGRSLLTFGAVGPEHLAALARVATRAGKLEVMSIDGEAAAGSGLEPAMREVGFGVSPRGLVIWPERQRSATA